MTDTAPRARIIFEIDLSKVSDAMVDDRTPTGLTRYGEKSVMADLNGIAARAIDHDTFRFERVEETTAAEPLTAQSEPKAVGAPLRLDGVALESCIVAVLREKGITEPVRTTMGRDILRHLLADANAWLVPNGEGVIVQAAVAEELDLNAFREQVTEAVGAIPKEYRTDLRVAEVVTKLLSDGNTPTKRLQGQGLNREQLTDVIANHLHEAEHVGELAALTMAKGLVSKIEAAQLDGTLS
jgi:hypothetical protein